MWECRTYEWSCHLYWNESYTFVDDKYATNHIQLISKFDPKYYTLILTIIDSIFREKISNKFLNNIKYFNHADPIIIFLSKDIINVRKTLIGANVIAINNIIESH